MAQSETVAIGINQSWGFSPSIDVLDSFYVNGGKKHEPFTIVAPSSSTSTSTAAPRHIRILLLGCADARHILHTIACSRRWGDSDKFVLHFYIVEESFHALARHLLLLSIAWDRTYSADTRRQLFLEVFGNAFVRQRTQCYLNEKAKELVNVITNDDSDSDDDDADAAGSRRRRKKKTISSSGTALVAQMLNLSHLKFKERDELQSIVEFWLLRNIESGKLSHSDIVKDFDMYELRDRRLRHYYADRYDARVNVIDWDYHMRIKSTTPIMSIIHYVHYRNWRQTGIAFEERWCKYVVPNRTLASQREGKDTKRHTSVTVRGYWSDCLVSPYIGFGVRCEESVFYTQMQEQHVRTAIHITDFNVRGMLEEWETGTKWELSKDERDAIRNPAAADKKKQQKEKEKEEAAGKAKATIEEVKEEGGGDGEVVQADGTIAPGTSDKDVVKAMTNISLKEKDMHQQAHPAADAQTTAGDLDDNGPELIKKDDGDGLLSPLPPLPRCHLHFLPSNGIAMMKSKANAAIANEEARNSSSSSSDNADDSVAKDSSKTFLHLFDRVVVSHSHAHEITPDLNVLLRGNGEGCLITADTVKYFPLKTEQKQAYVEKLVELGKACDWKVASASPKPTDDDDHVSFCFKSQ